MKYAMSAAFIVLCLFAGTIEQGGDRSLPTAPVDISHSLVMKDALKRVAQEFHAVIGLVEADYPAEGHKLIRFDFPHTTAAEVVKTLIAEDPSYTWRQDPDGAIHVYRTHGDPVLADVTIKSFVANGLVRSEISETLNHVPEIPAWARESKCVRQEGGSNDPWATDNMKKIFVRLHDRPLWEILDEVAKQAGTYYWSEGQYHFEAGNCSFGFQF
jgi:hypothetical protein